jgi:multiple sugar transport system ATP-binding protein
MFVGGFIGSPAMNMLEARIERRSGRLVVVLGTASIELAEATLSGHSALGAYEERDVVVGIRPEDLEDAALSEGGERPLLNGRATLREALGSLVLVHFTISARQAVTDEMRELAEDVGDDRAVEQLKAGAQSASATLVGSFSPRTRIAAGDEIKVSLDQRGMHFFDPHSGLAI